MAEVSSNKTTTTQKQSLQWPLEPPSQSDEKLSISSERIALPKTHLSGKGDSSRGGTSLRLRLLQTVLPVVLLPLLLMGLVGYRLLQHRSESRAQEQLQNQTLLTSESTAAVLDELRTLPRIIASSPLVINEVKAGNAQATAENLQQIEPDVLEERFQAKNRLLRSHYRLNTYLQETAESADIAEILITESHGYNVAYSQPVADFIQSDEDWWQNGKEYGLWVGPPDFNFAANTITVELVRSIQDPSTGDFLGVVKTILPARKFRLLAQYLKRTGISGSQRVQLIDGEKLKIIDTFSTQGFRKSRNIIGDQPVKEFIKVFSETIAQSPASSQLLKTLKNNTSAKNISIVFKEETTTIASFTSGDRQYKIANVPDTQWVAIASMEKSEISALGRTSLAFVALITLLLAAITTAFIMWLSRQLTAPLDSLANQAHQVAAGDFDTLVTPSGTAETRTLTTSFNQLVVQTKSLLDRQEIETQKAQIFAAITGTPTYSLADLKLVFDAMLPEVKRLLQVDRVFFYPVDPEYSVLLAAELAEFDLPSVLPLSADCVPLVLLSARPNHPAVAIGDTHQSDELDSSHQAYLRELAVRSTLSIPVFNENTLFGILVAHRSDPSQGPSQWQDADSEFMEQLAAQLKLVVDRVTSLQKVKESRRLEEKSRQVAKESRQVAEVLTVEKQARILEQQRQQEKLQQQLSALANDIQGVSQGDLTVRARSSEGELQTVADVFNQTVARLQELVNQVKSSTVQVNTFLSQNEESAVQLSQTTSAQKQEATRTLNSVQTMLASMDEIAQSAQQAAATAQTVAATVEAGETGMVLTAARLTQLNEASTIAVKQIQGFGRSGQHIGQVTTMIRDLATEIGTLSIQAQSDQAQSDQAQSETNHHLETITQKINHLADRTLEETTLIDSFLKTLEQRSQQVADSIDQISGQVSESTQLVQNSKQDFEEVAVVARQFDQLARSVSSATQSQTQTSEAVANLVKEVVGLSDQTATFSQDMESALSETLKIAQDLQNSVSRFKVDE